MDLNENVEGIMLKLNQLTNLDVTVTNDEMVIYFIGDIEKCGRYLHSEISKELKELTKVPFNKAKVYKDNAIVKIIDDDYERTGSQIIYSTYKDGKFDKFFIFNRPNGAIREDDITIINSSLYLIKKYFS